MDRRMDERMEGKIGVAKYNECKEILHSSGSLLVYIKLKQSQSWIKSLFTADHNVQLWLDFVVLE